MGDHGEVGEVPLDAGVQDHGGLGVAQRAAVLVQEVHQLLGDQPEQEHCNTPSADSGNRWVVNVDTIGQNAKCLHFC